MIFESTSKDEQKSLTQIVQNLPTINSITARALVLRPHTTVKVKGHIPKTSKKDTRIFCISKKKNIYLPTRFIKKLYYQACTSPYTMCGQALFKFQYHFITPFKMHQIKMVQNLSTLLFHLGPQSYPIPPF